MARGAIRPTYANEAVDRAFQMLTCVPVPPPGAPSDAGNRPIAYRLEDANGGKDPFAAHCADWSYGNRTPTSDCIGLALWCSGLDRFQPRYVGTRGNWLNCASLLDDADGAKVWCEPIDYWQARPGDWLLTRSHIGVIVRPALSASFDHVVVDCSPRHGRNTAIDTGGPWSGECRVVRYKHYRV